MAEAPEPRGDLQADLAIESLSAIRAAAQAHLEDIQHDIEQEELDFTLGQQEVQRYTRKRRSEARMDASSPSLPKAPKLRTALDVLHRLQWDDEFDPRQYTIGYLERFEGLKETSATYWCVDPTSEYWIPQHRIKYFKRNFASGSSEIVWHRDDRIDKIFGTGLNAKDSRAVG